MFNRRIKLPSKEVDRASVECLLQLRNNIVWCGLSSGVVKAFDLCKSTGQEVHSSENAMQTPQNVDTAHVIQELVLHSDRITCLVEVREHVWSSSCDTTIAITQPTAIHQGHNHDTESHNTRSVLRNHEFPVTTLVTSDTEHRVYSADSNGIVIEWSESTQCVLRRFTVAGSVTRMASTGLTLWLGLSTGVLGVDISEPHPNAVFNSVFVSTGAKRGVRLHTNSELLVRQLDTNDDDAADDDGDVDDYDDVSLCPHLNLSRDTSLSDIDDTVHPALVLFVADVIASNATTLGVSAVQSGDGNSNDDDDISVVVDDVDEAQKQQQQQQQQQQQKNTHVSPFPQDQDVLQGCTAVAIATTGELWVGGWGFLQVWTVNDIDNIECRVHWKIGQRGISMISPCPDAAYMCCASSNGSSEGSLLFFHMETGRPLRRIKCHDDMTISMCCVGDTSKSPSILACGSASWDGSITLIDNFEVLCKLDCSQFSTAEVLSSKKQADLSADWLGFYRERTEMNFMIKRPDARFDDSIVEAEQSAAHFRAWEMWETLDEPLALTNEWRLLCQHGIPAKLRPKYWKMIITMLTSDTQKFQREKYYHRILTHKQGKTSAAIRQIDLDISRTLPTNVQFRVGEPLYDALRRVLVAFSWLNPRIGYCQGLNRLAGFLLLILSEEDAFWGLVGAVEKHMGYEYYIDPLIVARADLLIFNDLIAHELPHMVKKFSQHDFNVGAVSFQWFFSLFVTTIPANFVLRIWDSFLLRGRSVLFKYALALLKISEESIMQATDQAVLFEVLSRQLHSLTNVDALTNIAFNAFSPELEARIETSRAIHESKARQEHAVALLEIQKDLLKKEAQAKERVLRNAKVAQENAPV